MSRVAGVKTQKTMLDGVQVLASRLMRHSLPSSRQDDEPSADIDSGSIEAALV